MTKKLWVVFRATIFTNVLVKYIEEWYKKLTFVKKNMFLGFGWIIIFKFNISIIGNCVTDFFSVSVPGGKGKTQITLW